MTSWLNSFWKIRKTKAAKLTIISLDGLLLLFFLVQSLTVGCLITYGYVPVPTKWANQKLLNKKFDGFYIQAKSFRLKLGQGVELIGLDVYHNEIKKPIFSAVSAEIQYRFKLHKAQRFKFTELALTNGTFMMPAVYAPNGKRTPVFENVTFHLTPTKDKIHINSLVAKHKDIYLRGAIEWPVGTNKKQEKTSITQIYELISTALEKKENFSAFVQPTLEFNLSTDLDRSVKISLLLSCEKLRHPKISGNHFSFGTDFVLRENTFIPKAPLLLSAREIKFADLDIFAENIIAQVKEDRWPDLFKGILPKFEISAYQLTAHEIELNAPRITIEPSAFPILQFSGTTCGLQGSAEFSGALNSQDRSGKITANGGIDIFNLLPDKLVEKLPELKFNSTPFYSLSVLFDKEFEVRSARFYTDFKDLAANQIQFNNVIAKGCYRDGELHFENIQINRKKQWVDARFRLDTKTQIFQIFLLGSVLPKQYNSLLPKWWSNIFEDLHFDPNTPGYGDFTIYGSTEKNRGVSLFGYVQADKFYYKDAFFDTCELLVRNQENYFEIDDISASVGDGQATGKLGFTIARKPQKGLISVRYHFDASLPIEVASNALGGEIASVINNFEVIELPYVQVDGVLFNKKFEQYADKNSVTLQGKLNAPLRFKDTPLDYLDFKLFGQGDYIYLRDVQFGYADGDANAIIDILPTEDSTKQMCFKLILRDANQAKAIEYLPGSNSDKQPVKSASEKSAQAARALGLVDVNLHAKGPLTDIYGYEGYGDIQVRNEALGAIRLMGPLSELLKNTFFSFTSFNLNRMSTVFTVDREQLVIDRLEINGPRTRIWADGTLQLPDQALDIDVKVSLFANSGRSDSAINAFGRAIASPLPNLLSFKLTGTVQNQKIRSKFDPRNLIF